MNNENALCLNEYHPFFDVMKGYAGACSFIKAGLDLVSNDIENMRYVPRSICEYLTEYRQVITYTLVGFIKDDELYLSRYCRNKNTTGESRLKGKLSLGYGGHVNDEGEHHLVGFNKMIYEHAMREINEELVIDTTLVRNIGYQDRLPLLAQPVNSFRTMGFVFDNTTEVGRSHFGVVSLLIMSEEEVLKMTGREPQIGVLSPMKLTDLKTADLNDAEKWSKIMISAL